MPRLLAAAVLAAALAVPATGAAHGGDDGERDHQSVPAAPAPPPAAAVPAADAVAPAPPALPAPPPPPDATAPALAGVHATLRRGRHAGRLRVTVSEDARLDVALRALGRSGDLVTPHRLTLFARAGTSSVRLPTMNLSARRYRLRIVAADRAGNRCAPVVAIVRAGRP